MNESSRDRQGAVISPCPSHSLTVAARKIHRLGASCHIAGEARIRQRIAVNDSPHFMIRHQTPLPLSLRRNFVWSLAGNVLYALSQWGVLVVLAKLCSPETRGLYLLGVTVTSPIFLFAGLQLRRLQATDSREEFQFGHYFGLQLAACVVGMFASWGWSLFAGHQAEALAVILLVGLNKSLETLSNTFYGLFQQHERLDRISKSMVLHGLLTGAGLCVGVALTGDVVLASALSVTGRLVAMLAYDVPSVMWLLGDRFSDSASGGKSRLWAVLRNCQPLWHWQPLKQLAVMGIPLGVTGMLVSLNTNLPRGFVESKCGLAELGIFGALCTPLAVMHTLTRALESSASAQLAKRHAEGDVSGFRRLVVRLMATHSAIALAGVLVAQLFGRELLTLFFTAEDAAHVDVFVTIMWATLVATSSGVMMTALIAARFIQIQLPLTALTSLVSLAACWWLVPTFGMQGAAISLLVSKLPYLAVGTLLLARLKPVKNEMQTTETVRLRKAA